jgi:glycosyltransferase involved in cell wall biosynthesis
VHEAAPNVVYEALAAGVPTLAFDRGCIPEMVSGARGGVCSRTASFAPFVVEYVRGLDMGAEERARRAADIKSSLLDECARADEQYAALMQLLGAPTAPVAQEFS